MRQFARLVALAALIVPTAVLGLASPALAVPTISVANKCGYIEITVVSDITTTADFGFLADAGGRNNVPVVLGTNVFTLVANPGDAGQVDVWVGEHSVKAPLYYVPLEGCHLPILHFAFQSTCGAKLLVTVKNTGDAPATHFSVYRVDIGPIPPAREAIVSDVTVPVGTSYFVADKLVGVMKLVQVTSGTDMTQETIRSGAPYQESTGCADAPKVTLAATCTGVDITSDPADAPLTTVVKGQPDTQDRTGTARKVAMSTDEALLVKSGDTVVDAFVYAKSSGCDAPPPSSPPGGSLPTTGDRVLLMSGIGVCLLLVGALVFAIGRSRRTHLGRS